MYGLSSKDDESQAQADPDMTTLRVRLFRFISCDSQSAAGFFAVAESPNDRGRHQHRHLLTA